MHIGSYEIQVPFVTTAADSVKTVLELADTKKKELIVDLGSGDGRMVLEFAKVNKNSTVHGFEIKSELVERSRKRIVDAGLKERITIFPTSFWDANLSKYDIIYIYGMGSIMGRLEKKLSAELKPGAKFITNIFRLPNWRVKKTSGQIYCYMKQ